MPLIVILAHAYFRSQSDFIYLALASEVEKSKVVYRAIPVLPEARSFIAHPFNRAWGKPGEKSERVSVTVIITTVRAERASWCQIGSSTWIGTSNFGTRIEP
jgi:hypothetical protein